MSHAVTLQRERIKGEQVAWVRIANHGKWFVFALLNVRIENTHRYLYVCVSACFTNDEIALKLTDTAHADFVAFCFEMQVESIF